MKRNVKYSRASSKTENKKLFKKFKKDPLKQYIKKIRIYPAFLYKYQDKWFKSMSLKGWHIVDCRMSIYLFEKGEPEEK